MPDKIKQNLPLILVFIFISIGAVTFYIKFASYRPEGVEEIQKIGESKKDEPAGIPYPDNYKVIRVDHTSKGEQITIEVDKTPEEVQTFYKTILLTSGWEIETETQNNTILSTEYKGDNQRITITTAWQESSQNTIVSINITP